MDLASLAFDVDTKGIKDASREFDNLGTAGEKSSNKATKGLGLLKGAVAAVGFAVLAREAVQYNNALKEVSTLVDTNKQSMSGLQKEIEAQAKAYGSNATDQAKAFYQAISAGADTAEKQASAMNAANRLAIGGATDVVTAIDGLTTASNAYGDASGSMTEISDKFFVAVKAGKTTVEELSSSIGKVAPLASSSGVSLDELLASTAALTKGGLSTSESITGLKATISNIIKPSKAAMELAAELGVEFNGAGLKSKGLAGFMADLAEKTKGTDGAMETLFGSTEALNSVLALTGGDDFNQVLGDMQNSAGATEEAFGKMAKSAGFQMDRIKATVTTTFLSLGSKVLEGVTPILTFFADNLPAAIEVVKKVIEPLKEGFVIFGEVVKTAYEAVKSVFNAVSPTDATMELTRFSGHQSYAATAAD